MDGSFETDKRSVALPEGLTHSYPPQALLHGVETRTSSPVRIVRDSQTLQCVGIQGLYPCGEGAVSLLLLHVERARMILTVARRESLSFSSRHDGFHIINVNDTLGIQILNLELPFSSRKNTIFSGIPTPSCRHDDTLCQDPHSLRRFFCDCRKISLSNFVGIQARSLIPITLVIASFKCPRNRMMIFAWLLIPFYCTPWRLSLCAS